MDLNSLSLKDAALEYERRGFTVIPCQGKVPLMPWKEWQNARPDSETISTWWDTWPDANVALVLGHGVFAVDVDGPEGHAALKASGIDNWLAGNSWPTSLTGRGVHYFFKGDQPDRIGLLPKVDVRGRGIVVVPPSVHATGKQYQWLVPLDKLQEAPSGLLGLLERPVNTQVATDGGSWLAEALAGVGEGVRNATCTRLAGYFLGKGMPEEAVIQLLLSWADRCAPRFPTNEVLGCVRSIAQREGPHTDEPKTLADGLLSVSQLYNTAPDEHEWVVEDYIPRGALIMVASEEKVGKSTLVGAMCSAIAHGEPFLGRTTTRCPILVLAVEEHITDVKLRAVKFGLQPGDPVKFYVGELGSDDQTYRDLRTTVQTMGAGLVVLDTLGQHLSSVLESENDNMAAIKAVRPWLHLARDTNAAVVIIHHAGKTGAAYRGASAFGGIVDQILTLRHGGGTFRRIESRGRYWNTPRDLCIRLIGNQYVVVE
ncbi:MAG TPA: bifunctional DNA primase/polymerase [Gemmatimonadales bacterium]|nr:bifunctional DNA primase/polymerase [Gemmatimonadales bacterium]